MHCGQCGQQIDDDSRFCRHCGAAQTRQDAPPPAGVGIDIAAAPVESPSPNARWLGWVAGGFVILLFIVILATTQRSTPTAPRAEETEELVSNVSLAAPDNAVAAPDNVAAAAGVEPVPDEENWVYSTDEDKVRGSITYYARTTSINTIHQDAPYEDATSMSLSVRKSPAYGTDVILTVSSGQMMCPSYESCSGTVRFDDGPAERIRFAGPADDSSETIFVQGAKSFIAKLKKAKKLIVEKTLYQAGNPQFEFNVANLKWDH